MYQLRCAPKLYYLHTKRGSGQPENFRVHEAIKQYSYPKVCKTIVFASKNAAFDFRVNPNIKSFCIHHNLWSSKILYLCIMLLTIRASPTMCGSIRTCSNCAYDCTNTHGHTYKISRKLSSTQWAKFGCGMCEDVCVVSCNVACCTLGSSFAFSVWYAKLVPSRDVPCLGNCVLQVDVF